MRRFGAISGLRARLLPMNRLRLWPRPTYLTLHRENNGAQRDRSIHVSEAAATDTAGSEIRQHVTWKMAC